MTIKTQERIAWAVLISIPIVIFIWAVFFDDYNANAGRSSGNVPMYISDHEHIIIQVLPWLTFDSDYAMSYFALALSLFAWFGIPLALCWSSSKE